MENTLRRSKSFRLGYCACGCRTKITIRNHSSCKFIRFVTGHNGIGKNNGNWKGGQKLTGEGYISTRIDIGKYQKTHRFVYEQHYHCCLLSWVIIHHKNENRLDNRIENLQPMTLAQHQRIHHTKDMTNRFCSDCGGKTILRKEGWEDWHFSKVTRQLLCAKCCTRERRRMKRSLE